MSLHLRQSVFSVSHDSEHAINYCRSQKKRNGCQQLKVNRFQDDRHFMCKCDSPFTRRRDTHCSHKSYRSISEILPLYYSGNQTTAKPQESCVILMRFAYVDLVSPTQKLTASEVVTKELSLTKRPFLTNTFSLLDKCRTSILQSAFAAIT